MDNDLKELINTLKCYPLRFSLSNAKTLTEAIRDGRLKDGIIRKTAVEVLDLSPKGIFRSTAASGIVGYINQRVRAKRQDRFWDRIQSGFRENESNIVAVAEGDSWFEHPLLHDIIDHINREKHIAVFSLAYAADWLDNILYQGEYVDMLSVIKPDVFLVSGGGNDLLGDKKIGIMCQGIDPKRVEKNIQEHTRYVYTDTIPERYREGLEDNDDAEAIRDGVKYLTKEFFGFLNIMQWQYYFLFSSIRSKYQDMPIITQSYDFARPQASIERPPQLAYWFQWLVNTLQQSGKWIETAMRTANITDTNQMRNAIKAMLYLFKQMVIETSAPFSYIYHIDSQGLCRETEWFDEIHIKSHKFLRVGKTYVKAMEEAVNQRNEHLKHGLITNELPRVYKSSKTTLIVSFGEAFSAFYRAKGWPHWTVLLVLLICLSLNWWRVHWCFWSPGVVRKISIGAGFLLVPYAYGLLRALVLSRLYAKQSTNNSNATTPPHSSA